MLNLMKKSLRGDEKIETVVKGTPKEIANLVFGVQDQHEMMEVIKNSLGEEIIVRQTKKGTE